MSSEVSSPHRISDEGRPFSRIAIVGIGLIGGSIALAARQNGLAEEIIGIDADAETRDTAVGLGIVDQATDNIAEGIAKADLVLLAIPVPAILELLPNLSPLLAPNALVTDVGSVKGPIAQAGWNALNTRFIAGHPMAGSERHGVTAARANLFTGATWAITPTVSAQEQAAEQLRAFVTALGANPIILPPDEHDRYVAVTSHVPHVLAYALYALARRYGDDSPLWKLAAGGFHSTTRVAASSPEMWTGICLSNQENVAEELRVLIGELGKTLTTLEESDREALFHRFRDGHRH